MNDGLTFGTINQDVVFESLKEDVFIDVLALISINFPEVDIVNIGRRAAEEFGIDIERLAEHEFYIRSEHKCEEVKQLNEKWKFQNRFWRNEE